MRWDTKPRDLGNISTGTGNMKITASAMGYSIRPKNTQILRTLWASWVRSLSSWLGWSRSVSVTLTFVAFWSITLTLSRPCPDAFAEIPTETAVRILIGEACNLGPVGMQAVAEVLRRRDPSAFSTLRRKDLDAFIAKQAAWYKSVKKQDLYEVARTAWRKSARSNLTKGATLYENIQDFGFPKSWKPQKVKQVAVIGSHTFFQEKKG